MDRNDAIRTFGIDVPELGDMAVAENIGELHFDSGEYADFEQFKWNLRGLTAKPRGRKPSCKSLSVNGRCVQDRMDKYLAALGESSSALKEALKSPIHYAIFRNENLKPRDESHFTLGTFIHSAFLEPSKFSKVKVLPEGAARNTINGLTALVQYYEQLLGIPPFGILSEMKMACLKDRVAELESAAREQGYTFIGADDADIVRIVKDSYMRYGGGIIPRLVASGRTEMSMYGRDASTGLEVKIRPDCALFEEQVGINAILSVKTTSATSIEGFMRDAAKYRYELAEGMYLKVASEITGRRFTGTLMLVAQTCIPYQCFLLWLDAEDLAIGKYKYQQALDIVRQCKDSGRWPGFETFAEEDASGVIQMRFPSWIRNELKPQYIPE